MVVRESVKKTGHQVIPHKQTTQLEQVLLLEPVPTPMLIKQGHVHRAKAMSKYLWAIQHRKEDA